MPTNDAPLRVYHEPIEMSCPKGHTDFIPSGRGKNFRETDDGYESDFICPDCGSVFSHWVRVEAPPSEADPDTLMH